jgi:hypothetical protein
MLMAGKSAPGGGLRFHFTMAVGIIFPRKSQTINPRFK